MTNTNTISGFIGLLAAVLVGTGEFLLHFDALGRFAGEDAYLFMQGISVERTTLGHFFGVLGAPLYVVGFWHLMKMLEPAGQLASRVAFAVMSYGIMVGAVWIGSRASISAMVNFDGTADLSQLIALYELRYESLLQVTRVAALVFSAIYMWLVLSGRSLYPKWMALLNPVFLILVSFGIWILLPALGDYLMPVALNLAFAILFVASIYYSANRSG
jgi:hypothetical protein